VDTLNLWLHFVEVDKGCLHIIKLEQTGHMTHLLTCDHNHKILVYSRPKIEKFNDHNRTLQEVKLCVLKCRSRSYRSVHWANYTCCGL